MDLANASIVVMSERHPRSQMLTVDRTDFSIYRRNDRQVIDFIAPPKSQKRLRARRLLQKESSIVDPAIIPGMEQGVTLQLSEYTAKGMKRPDGSR
jgi:hypothetical protein